MAVVAVVPAGIDDPRRPSGGNVYDRRLLDGLTAAGWSIDERLIPGPWPRPDAAAERHLAEAVGTVADGAVLLVDGLIASAAPAVLVPAATRLRLVVLVHLPLGLDPTVPDASRTGEPSVLAAARAVITTSGWARDELVRRYGLEPGRLYVAEPGVDPAELGVGTPGGGALLCVAAVTPQKGQDVLVDALAGLDEFGWSCACVGSLERDPAFVTRLRRQARAHAVADRVRFTGALTGRALADAYARADVLVHPSRGETYGLVVTEALARGRPVIASAVGGLPAALGRTDGGVVPGLLVAPGDPSALRGALRRWLSDGALRHRLTAAAGARRSSLPAWDATVRDVAGPLAAVAGRRL